MTQLVQGGNAPVPTGRLSVEVDYAPSAKVPEVDVSTFLLRATGKVAGDADMVFYGNRTGAGGAVELGDGPGGLVRYAVDLSRVPAEIERLPFVATIDQAEAKGLTFADVGGLSITVRSGVDPVARFDVGAVGRETSLILGELYRRQGAWKFRAVAQGYAGGLKPLAESYGMDISDPAPASPAPVPPPAPPQPVQPPVPQPAPSPVPSVPPSEPPRQVNLSKVSLTKANPRISLEKKTGGYGEIGVNLNWNRGPSGGLALFKRRSGGVDLDLGCLYELANGERSGIQALGDAFGDFDRRPYIRLKGDDRTGDVSEGEWIHVNGRRFDEIRRILFFAFIYDGAPNWRSTDGVVTVSMPGQPPVEVRLDEGNDLYTMCAVALVENVQGEMRISREVRYFKGHRDMDRAYGWGLNWVAGSKD